MKRFLACCLFASAAICGLEADGGEPDPRPASVAEAVEVVRGWLDEEGRLDLAFMSKDELILLHHGLGMSIRNGLGMWGDNERLRADCPSPHPDNCSMVIIRRLHARLRAELTVVQRRALKAQDKLVGRITVPAHAASTTTIAELAAFLQAQIDAQVPADRRFHIRHSAADAVEALDFEFRGGSLADALEGIDMFSGVDVIKRPPDYLLEPHYRPLGDLAPETDLAPVFTSSQGLGEETVALINDDAAFQALWARMGTAVAADTAPVIDFTRNTALVVSLGERPTSGYQVGAQFKGLHREHVVIARVIKYPGELCAMSQSPTSPTAIYVLPKYTGGLSDFDLASMNNCAR